MTISFLLIELSGFLVVFEVGSINHKKRTYAFHRNNFMKSSLGSCSPNHDDRPRTSLPKSLGYRRLQLDLILRSKFLASAMILYLIQCSILPINYLQRIGRLEQFLQLSVFDAVQYSILFRGVRVRSKLLVPRFRVFLLHSCRRHLNLRKISELVIH